MLLDAEKISLVKSLSGEMDEGTVSTYLSIAGNKICRHAYPFNPTVTEVPDRYALTQVGIAVYLLNKRGAEGELSHAENGISRTYENADVPISMLRGIVPMCGTFGGDTE